MKELCRNLWFAFEITGTAGSLILKFFSKIPEPLVL
jgi:hypothetical protein